MSERPIEEIIGWTRNPEYTGDGWAWIDDRKICHDCAEVDDLLTWLIANDAEIISASTHRNEDCLCWAETIAATVTGIRTAHYGESPTALGALSLAVREVADHE